jgi:hypothetical protein
MLPLEVMRSDALTTAPPAVRWALVVIALDFRGTNNGALTLTRARAAQFGINSSDTRDRALHMLMDRGLIVRTHPGQRRPPSPSRYAVTWHPINATEWTKEMAEATHDYRHWKSTSEVRPPDPLGPTTGHRTGPTTGLNGSDYRTRPRVR